MNRTLYSVLFHLALPLIALRLAWRAWQAPAYARRIAERFALALPPLKPGGIWLHAVSVGESIAAAPLVRELLARYPELPVTAVKGDILDKAFAETLPDGFDFIASNPPYIETSELPLLQREVQKEPKTALDGGADGLIFYRAICDIWAKKLHPNGVLAVEIGETQGQAVKVLFEAAGLRDVRIHKDLGALDRAVSGVR